MFGKKGLTAYVSWILVTAFAVSMSVFMYALISDQVDNSTSQIETHESESLCNDVGLTVDEICQNTQTLNMNITNINLLNIKKLKIRFFDLYDNVESTDLNLALRPGDTQVVEVLKQGTLRQVEIIPVVQSDDEILCINNIVTLQDIKVC